DGMEVETLDGEPFLAINGVQTLSHAYTDLSAAVPDLLDLGIRRLRLSPHASVDMVAVSETYRAVIDGKTAPDEASERLSALAGDATFCNGYINNQTGYTFS
ncbi:MAG: U32 family peptidase, partial [Rhodospirillaceae bacterium]|nr:U32 family peptidase [Rhodospirillaceae bacterium]